MKPTTTAICGFSFVFTEKKGCSLRRVNYWGSVEFVCCFFNCSQNLLTREKQLLDRAQNKAAQTDGIVNETKDALDQATAAFEVDSEIGRRLQAFWTRALVCEHDPWSNSPSSPAHLSTYRKPGDIKGRPHEQVFTLTSFPSQVSFIHLNVETYQVFSLTTILVRASLPAFQQGDLSSKNLPFFPVYTSK